MRYSHSFDSVPRPAGVLVHLSLVIAMLCTLGAACGAVSAHRPHRDADLKLVRLVLRHTPSVERALARVSDHQIADFNTCENVVQSPRLPSDLVLRPVAQLDFFGRVAPTYTSLRRHIDDLDLAYAPPLERMRVVVDNFAALTLAARHHGTPSICRVLMRWKRHQFSRTFGLSRALKFDAGRFPKTRGNSVLADAAKYLQDENVIDKKQARRFLLTIDLSLYF